MEQALINSTAGVMTVLIAVVAFWFMLEKKTGARALRQIIENFMLDIMFDLPSRKDQREYVISDQNIKGEEPIVPRALKSTKKEKNGDSKKETA